MGYYASGSNHASVAAKADEQPKGKRADHDALPDDIKAKYVENLSILQRMRELHLRLRSLSLDSATCPDSERYPFLKELISLDKKLQANWEAYDTYVIGQSAEVKSNVSRPLAKNHLVTHNLNLKPKRSETHCRPRRRTSAGGWCA